MSFRALCALLCSYISAATAESLRSVLLAGKAVHVQLNRYLKSNNPYVFSTHVRAYAPARLACFRTPRARQISIHAEVPRTRGGRFHGHRQAGLQSVHRSPAPPSRPRHMQRQRSVMLDVACCSARALEVGAAYGGRGAAAATRVSLRLRSTATLPRRPLPQRHCVRHTLAVAAGNCEWCAIGR